MAQVPSKPRVQPTPLSFTNIAYAESAQVCVGHVRGPLCGVIQYVAMGVEA